jgi:hypothetical protein
VRCVLRVCAVIKLCDAHLLSTRVDVASGGARERSVIVFALLTVMYIECGCVSVHRRRYQILSNQLVIPYSTIPGFPLSTVQGQGTDALAFDLTICLLFLLPLVFSFLPLHITLFQIVAVLLDEIIANSW